MPIVCLKMSVGGGEGAWSWCGHSCDLGTLVICRPTCDGDCFGAWWHPDWRVLSAVGWSQAVSLELFVWAMCDPDPPWTLLSGAELESRAPPSMGEFAVSEGTSGSLM